MNIRSVILAFGLAIVYSSFFLHAAAWEEPLIEQHSSNGEKKKKKQRKKKKSVQQAQQAEYIVEAQADLVNALLQQNFRKFKQIIEEHEKENLGIQPINMKDRVVELVQERIKKTDARFSIFDFPECIRDRTSISLLALATFLGRTVEMEFLCKKYPGSIDQEDDCGMTPLMHATIHNQLQAAVVLLQYDADPTLKCGSEDALDMALDLDDARLAAKFYQQLKNPPIERIIIFDDIKRMEKLLKEDPKLLNRGIDSEGATPFMLAVLYNSNKMAQYLFEQGANVLAMTPLGKIAYDYATYEMQGLVEKYVQKANELKVEQARQEADKRAKRLAARAAQNLMPKAAEDAAKEIGKEPKVEDLIQAKEQTADKRRQKKHAQNLARKARKAEQAAREEARGDEEQKRDEERAALAALTAPAVKPEEDLDLANSRSGDDEKGADFEGYIRAVFDGTIFTCSDSTLRDRTNLIQWITDHAPRNYERGVVNALDKFLPAKNPQHVFGVPKGYFTIDAILDICLERLPKHSSYHR